MLHDARKSADAFQIDTLISWLECQPPEQEYNYMLPCKCMLARYFGAHGYKRPYLTTDTISEFADPRQRTLPPHFDRIAEAKPHTFGAALDRARQFA